METASPSWRLVDVIRSRFDATVKFVFTSGGKVIELSFIDKGDGKHIICAPTQSSCRLGCRFCHLTGLNLPVVNLAPVDTLSTLTRVVGDLGLTRPDRLCPTLLVSFMGCGEPLLNAAGTVTAAGALRSLYQRPGLYRTVRFAVASLIPSERRMREFTASVAAAGLPCKFHWSLHTANEAARRELMPAALPLGPAADLVSEYVRLTGNAAEAHYALMEGDNDTDADAAALVALLRGRPVNVKFLRYNEKPGQPMRPSRRVAEFRALLEEAGLATEYYEPPGSDIGSSCGQFLVVYYTRYAPPQR